jgi:group I intron endonuclease
MIVYIVTNKITKKKYIGYTTKSLEIRISQHLSKAYNEKEKHYNYLFQRSIRKHGIKNFVWEVIYIASTKKECCDKEIFYIKKYNTLAPNGYNLTKGGDGGIQCEETKLKISKSLKDFYLKNPEKKGVNKNKTSQVRSDLSKKAWVTKRIKGFKTTKGFTHASDSKNKMSITKNLKNKLNWINIKTDEKQSASLTDMSKYTGLSIGVFNHIKHGRQIQTKCGWKLG